MEPKSAFGKVSKVFSSKIGPYSLKKCLRSEPNKRFTKNYLTELLQKTLLRCDVKSSKSLKSFSKELFFCSGLPNTRSLGRGDRYQHQDNPIVSLVLLTMLIGTLQCIDLGLVFISLLGRRLKGKGKCNVPGICSL